MNEIRDELNQKIAEVRRLQMELNKRENAEADGIADGLKTVIASLEKENNDLKVCMPLYFLLVQTSLHV